MTAWLYWVHVAFWMPSVFLLFSGTLVHSFLPRLPRWGELLLVLALIWITVCELTVLGAAVLFFARVPVGTPARMFWLVAGGGSAATMLLGWLLYRRSARPRTITVGPAVEHTLQWPARKRHPLAVPVARSNAGS
jgi:hypothetical protein